MSAVIEDQGTVTKPKSARFRWPILRGIALMVALSAFIADLPFMFYGAGIPIALPVFMLATLALIAMTPPGALPESEGAGPEMVRQHRLPWPLLIYCVTTGVGYNWVCAFLWFSRRYAVFSKPVVGAMGLILAFYAAVGVVTAWLTGGNWRTALLVFAVASCALGAIVLRLHLFQ